MRILLGNFSIIRAYNIFCINEMFESETFINYVVQNSGYELVQHVSLLNTVGIYSIMINY